MSFFPNSQHFIFRYARRLQPDTDPNPLTLIGGTYFGRHAKLAVFFELDPMINVAVSTLHDLLSAAQMDWSRVSHNSVEIQPPPLKIQIHPREMELHWAFLHMHGL